MNEQALEPAVEPVQEPPAGSRPVLVTYQLAVVVPVILWLALMLGLDPHPFLEPSLVFWALAVALVDLMPVSAWGGLQLSLSFPILLTLSILFPPGPAALAALVGSADPRELKGQISPLKALFGRSQIALSVVAASVLFHAVASIHSGWFPLLPAVILAALAQYSVNTVLVALFHSLSRALPLRRVLIGMHGVAPLEFLVAYFSLGVFGVVLARVYVHEGLMSVAVILGLLVFARQMYFRSRGLSDRLVEQNTLLAAQAEELQRLLTREQRTVEELQELNRLKSDFVAVASHELRTPLTTIIGYVKTLRQPQFADDPLLRDEFLETMERQGDRLMRLVENLLATSRVESDQLAVAIGPVAIPDLCREILEGMGARANRVRRMLPDDLPIVFTDRYLLGRILSNLLDNALKYSPDGSACELGVRREDADVAVWVRDHGVGIAAQDLDHIFERFYQTESSATRTYRGVGLGLSLVKDLAESLGGRVDVESRLGQGSVFTLVLPLRHPSVRAESHGSGHGGGDGLTDHPVAAWAPEAAWDRP